METLDPRLTAHLAQKDLDDARRKAMGKTPGRESKPATIQGQMRMLVDRECVTHHYACDCRERAFAELLEKAKEILTCSMQPCPGCREPLREAIAKLEGKQ